MTYVDYYLLHNFQTVYYDGVDGKGGVVKTCRLIDHALKWKADGTDVTEEVCAAGQRLIQNSF